MLIVTLYLQQHLESYHPHSFVGRADFTSPPPFFNRDSNTFQSYKITVELNFISRYTYLNVIKLSAGGLHFYRFMRVNMQQFF